MGYYIGCCKKEENTDNIEEKKEEIINEDKEEDYLKIADDNNYSASINQIICYKINPDLPLDFPYTSKLINNNKIFLTTNIYDDNQQEFLINDINYLEEHTIYDMENLTKEQSIKLSKYFEYCNKNGKPRSSDDFDQNGWKKFYPKDEPFFIINDTEINHNQLKIYNENDINNIKIYQGDLNIFGHRHGFGKFTTSYYVLIGMWKEDNFSGWGRESRCNGDVFEGRYENGFLNGKGIFLNSNQSKYIGEFKNMRRWGKGKLATNKIIYEGDFYNNQMHGNGRIKFLENGLEYIGEFKYNQIHGHGVFKWRNGNEYEGEFKNGKIIRNLNYKYNDDIISPKKQINLNEEENDEKNNNKEKNNDIVKISDKIYINKNNNNTELNKVDNGFSNYKNNTTNINSLNNGSNNDKIKNYKLDNNKINNEIRQEEEKVDKYLLISTYRNYGFVDDNNSFT